MIVQGWWCPEDIYADTRIIDVFEAALGKKISIHMMHYRYPQPEEFSQEVVEGNEIKVRSFELLKQPKFRYYKYQKEFLDYLDTPHFVVIDDNVIIENRHTPLEDIRDPEKRKCLIHTNKGWLYRKDVILARKMMQIFWRLKEEAEPLQLTEKGFSYAPPPLSSSGTAS